MPLRRITAAPGHRKWYFNLVFKGRYFFKVFNDLHQIDPLLRYVAGKPDQIIFEILTR